MVVIGNYTIGSVLGRGKFGWVSRARHLHLDLDVAVKHAPWRIGQQCKGGREHSNCDHVKDSLWKASLKHEASVLSSISHPAIVSLLDVVDEPSGSIYICLEDLGNTSLTSFVLGRDCSKVEEFDAAVIFFQLLSGLNYLHLNGILHRDIKPENIMIMQGSKGSLTAKLIDLGLSAMWAPESMLNSSVTRAGTLAYMAPELMKPHVAYGNKVDIFSMGASLYFTLVGEAPFSEFERNKVRSTTSIFGLQIFHEESLALLSQNSKDLIQSMIQIDPNLRCDLSMAYKHVWFVRT